MSMTALFSSPLTNLPAVSRRFPSSSSSSSSSSAAAAFSKSRITQKPYLPLTPQKSPFPGLSPKAQSDGSSAAATVEDKLPEKKVLERPETAVGRNGSPVAAESGGATKADRVAKFEDPRWAGGTWDLKLFQKDGKTNWDAVIDAEARRRKWLEENPEATSYDEPVVFDTAIIPWWAWMKRFHLPEAEKLNGRAAMIGFFMAYLVDSLTGLGVVDQMGNVVCKTLLFVAVAGVLLIRKNEDIETLKKLIEETTFYDKQWQATWNEEASDNFKND